MRNKEPGLMNDFFLNLSTIMGIESIYLSVTSVYYCKISISLSLKIGPYIVNVGCME